MQNYFGEGLGHVLQPTFLGYRGRNGRIISRKEFGTTRRQMGAVIFGKGDSRVELLTDVILQGYDVIDKGSHLELYAPKSYKK